MKTFRTLEEVEAAGLSPPLREVVHRVVKGIIDAYAEYGETHRPDEHGYTILVEEGDSDADVEAEVGYDLRTALFEGGLYEGGCFLTCTLHNNEYGISWVLPDAPWLDPEIREKLADACGGADP